MLGLMMLEEEKSEGEGCEMRMECWDKVYEEEKINVDEETERSKENSRDSVIEEWI